MESDLLMKISRRVSRLIVDSMTFVLLSYCTQVHKLCSVHIVQDPCVCHAPAPEVRLSWALALST